MEMTEPALSTAVFPERHTLARLVLHSPDQQAGPTASEILLIAFI